MPQIPQNTISQTALKYYNQFKIIITEALRWLQTTIDTVNKIKVETESKEIYRKLKYFITI